VTSGDRGAQQQSIDLLAPESPASTDLERRCEAWIADYFNARHLLRTRDWAVALDACADRALRVAALTHDIERRVPGGPTLDPRRQRWDDAQYLREHSARSAQMVSEWLVKEGGDGALRGRVQQLILDHETGGEPCADVLQAADSLSFLEVNASRARSWVDSGRCSLDQAQAKLDWMRDRIAIPAAREPAARLHRTASSALLGDAVSS
jgi:hypothetical protein